MTRYLLDTNIISAVIKPSPPQGLINWLGDQQTDDLFISTFTLAELKRGILEKPAGRRRKFLEQWFDGNDGPPSQFRARIFSFDEAAAFVWARLMAEGTAKGRPRPAIDTAVAAIAVANDCVVVTDNERDFWGLSPYNPCR